MDDVKGFNAFLENSGLNVKVKRVTLSSTGGGVSFYEFCGDDARYLSDRLIGTTLDGLSCEDVLSLARSRYKKTA